MRKPKMTEELSAPPPLPDLGEANKPELNEWYYVAKGSRHGPTTAAAIKSLLDKKEIEIETQVWRKGMPDWRSLRESDLADLVAAEPPAISSQHIGNGYV
jgi:hypothetical protein